MEDSNRKKSKLEAPINDEIYFPGDIIDNIIPNSNFIHGIMIKRDESIGTKVGQLNKIGPNFHIDNIYQKWYEPSPADHIIGIIIEKYSDHYSLDINASFPGFLPFLAFEGASKRNRPQIEIGSVVYCRVLQCHKDMETELTCISPYSKKEWMTGQSLFGELKDGFLIHCSLHDAFSLIPDDCYVLKCLEEYLAFEIAIGLNGRLWIHSRYPYQTIIIINAILTSFRILNSGSKAQQKMKIKAMIKTLCSSFVK